MAQSTVASEVKSAEKPTGKAGLFVGVRQSLERRKLDKNLAFNLNAARAHEKNGLPIGHPDYQSLFNDSMDQLRASSGKWGILLDNPRETPRNELKVCLIAQYPAIHVLKSKTAVPAPSALKAAKPGVGKLAFIVVVLIPVAWAIMSVIHHSILCLFGM